MDLSSYSTQELRELQIKIEREIEQRKSRELQEAREQIHAIARSVGLPLEELVVTARNIRTGATVAPRYRNPADASQLWTGRGRKPKWVKDWVDAGNSLDGLKF
jgi:DNA-binding protein H-NS